MKYLVIYMTFVLLLQAELLHLLLLDVLRNFQNSHSRALIVVQMVLCDPQPGTCRSKLVQTCGFTSHVNHLWGRLVQTALVCFPEGLAFVQTERSFNPLLFWNIDAADWSDGPGSGFTKLVLVQQAFAAVRRYLFRLQTSAGMQRSVRQK